MKAVALAASLLAFESTTLTASHAGPNGPPLRLAIYYGYPSLVEHAGGDVQRAVAVFARYDVIVFGDGLELAPESIPESTSAAGLRAERQRIGPLIAALHATGRRPAVYGYIDLGSSQNLEIAEIARRTGQWKTIGADGIFFDEAGRDFGVTPPRRRDAVRAVHALGLRVLMNAFHLEDLFDDADAGSDAVGRLAAGDALLLESFGIINGEFEPVARVQARAAAAVKYRDRYGVRVFAAATTGARPVDAARVEYAWWTAAAWDLDAMAWGERDYSADSALPWRPPPAPESALSGSTTISTAVVVGDVVRRSTTAGTIVVDLAARRGWLERR